MIPFHSPTFIRILIQRKPTLPFQPKHQNQFTCDNDDSSLGVPRLRWRWRLRWRQGRYWHVPHILQYRWRRCGSGRSRPPSHCRRRRHQRGARGRPRHALQRQLTRHFRSDLFRHCTSRAGGELSLDAGTVVSCRCPQNKRVFMDISDMSDRALTN